MLQDGLAPLAGREELPPPNGWGHFSDRLGQQFPIFVAPGNAPGSFYSHCTHHLGDVVMGRFIYSKPSRAKPTTAPGCPSPQSWRAGLLLPLRGADLGCTHLLPMKSEPDVVFSFVRSAWV